MRGDFFKFKPPREKSQSDVSQVTVVAVPAQPENRQTGIRERDLLRGPSTLGGKGGTNRRGKAAFRGQAGICSAGLRRKRPGGSPASENGAQGVQASIWFVQGATIKRARSRYPTNSHDWGKPALSKL